MYKSLVLAVVALTSLATAQSNSTTGVLPQLPQCATTCIYLPPACNLDPSCICNDRQWISDISCCVFTNCNAADQAIALQYAQGTCTPVGATLPSSASCANSTTNGTTNGTASSSSAAAASATSARSSGLAGHLEVHGPAVGGIAAIIMGAVALL